MAVRCVVHKPFIRAYFIEGTVAGLGRCRQIDVTLLERVRALVCEVKRLQKEDVIS